MIGIIYGALVAMVQPDMKKLVAYSSVSHLGFVVLGLCAMNVQGVQGAVYQMLNHGISTGGLFLIVGMLSDRRHTRLISEFGGLKAVMPQLVAAFLIITLASIALPGMNGFVGEFLILLGAFRWSPQLTAFAATGVILSAVYMLWMFQRVNYGPITNEKNRALPDLTPREWAMIGADRRDGHRHGRVPEPVPRSRWSRRSSAWSSGSTGSQDRAAATARRRRPPTAARRAARRRQRGERIHEPRLTPAPSFRSLIVVAGRRCCDARRGLPQPGERMPIGGLGLIGLVGAAVASVLALGHATAVSFGVVRADNFALFINIVALHHRHADDAVLERRGRAGAAAGRRVLRADAVRHLRHDADGRGDRPAGHLPRARDPVARRSTC